MATVIEPPQTWAAKQAQVKARANTRQVHLDTCRHCGRAVLVGLDADTTALTARCDPEPHHPTRHQEVAAVLTGRATYTVLTARGGKELHYRDEYQISSPHRPYPIVYSHQCATTTTEELS